MLKAIGSFFRFLEGVTLIGLAFWFLGWYIKMHFNPKWFWLFWINTIMSISMYCTHASNLEKNTKKRNDIWDEKYYRSENVVIEYYK